MELSTALSEIQEGHAKQMSQLTRTTSAQMAQATQTNQELRSRNEYLERQLEKAKYVLNGDLPVALDLDLLVLLNFDLPVLLNLHGEACLPVLFWTNKKCIDRVLEVEGSKKLKIAY